MIMNMIIIWYQFFNHIILKIFIFYNYSWKINVFKIMHSIKSNLPIVNDEYLNQFCYWMFWRYSITHSEIIGFGKDALI